MLGETLVDVIRRRNMSDQSKIGSPKWQRAVRTVDWITTQVPATSQFQIYGFNTQVSPLLKGTLGQWQATQGGSRLSAAVQALKSKVPQQGTSLENAFKAAASLSPRPDSIFLLTDGLPTQDASGTRKGLVNGDKRARYFRDALKSLPSGVPVNVILFPMEGDPIAASAYWQLARSSGGAFLSPPRDWP